MPESVTVDNGGRLAAAGWRECQVVIKQYLGSAGAASGLFGVERFAGPARLTPAGRPGHAGALRVDVRAGRLSVVLDTRGSYTVELLDTRGAVEFMTSGMASGPVAIALEHLTPGGYLARLHTAAADIRRAVAVVR